MGALTLLVWVGFAVYYAQKKQRLLEEAWASAEGRSRKVRSEIDTALNRLVPVNLAISEDLTAGRLKKDAIEARLIRDKTENPNIFGLGVAYVPYGFNPDMRLYAPLFVNQEDGEPRLIHIEDDYDYTEPDRDWYHLPQVKGPIWQEPHYGEASKAYLANFTTPFFSRDPETGKPIHSGVVFSSMSLTQYQDLVNSLGLGDLGYAFILSRKGAFVAHPDPELVTGHKTITEWAREQGDERLELLGRNAALGIRGFIERGEARGGRSQWVFAEPINAADWSVGIVFYKDRLVDWDQLKLFPPLLAVLGILALVLLLFAYLSKGQTPRAASD